ncbi:DddA-like double-stranded DNA deaminase toxin [Kribbella caucasensis]
MSTPRTSIGSWRTIRSGSRRGADTLGSHVEIKFAMLMRKRALTDETITINNRPCPGPYGCHRNLWRFLPDGARLTVYGPDSFKRTYPESGGRRQR